MISKSAIVVMCLLSLTAWSCQEAIIDSPNFCNDFQQATACHCTHVLHLPRFCQNINIIHQRMLSIYHDLRTACERQQYSQTDVQDCIDHWNCYYQGGVDSKNRACSSTKRACV